MTEDGVPETGGLRTGYTRKVKGTKIEALAYKPFFKPTLD